MRRWAWAGAALAALCAADGGLGQAAPAQQTADFHIADDPVIDLAWAPDGEHIAYCGTNGCHVLDAATGAVTADMRDAYSGIAAGGDGVMAFTPDGNTLILAPPAAETGNFLSLWDVHTGARIRSIPFDATLPGHSPAEMASSSKNLAVLAASTRDRASPIVIFSLPTMRTTAIIPASPFGSPLSIALAPSGGQIALTNDDSTVVVLDVASGKLLGRVSYTAGWANKFDWSVQPPAGLAFSPDDRYLAMGFANIGSSQVFGPNGTMTPVPSPWPTEPVYIWHVTGGVPNGAPMKLCGAQEYGVQTLLWTADSRAVIYTDGRGTLMFCPLTGAPAMTLFKPFLRDEAVPALSPNGREIALGIAAHIYILKTPEPDDKGS